MIKLFDYKIFYLIVYTFVDQDRPLSVISEQFSDLLYRSFIKLI